MDKKNRKEMLQNFKKRSVIGGVFAIVNTVTEKKLLGMTTDIQGSYNRFEFAQSVNSCIHPRLQHDWEKLGGHAFRFDELELLVKKPEQSDSDFLHDIEALFDMTTNGALPDRYE